MTWNQSICYFNRLQESLSRSKADNLEDKCSRLQCEYQALQQKLWQKNIKLRQQRQAELNKQRFKEHQKERVTVRFIFYFCRRHIYYFNM